MTLDYEYMEWSYPAKGVFWRIGGHMQAEFEKLERQGWRVFHSHNNGVVLRRKLTPRRRKT
jgi:hypothetical protein